MSCAHARPQAACLREKRSFLKETILRVYVGTEGHTAPTGRAERKTGMLRSHLME